MDVSALQPDEVLAVLTKAVPELSEIESSTNGVSENGERLLYQEMTDVAWCLVLAKQQGREDELKTIFDAVEDMLAAGSPSVRNLVIVGLLEDTQNGSLRAEIPLRAWEPMLGKETLEGWNAVERFWVKKINAKKFKQIVDGKHRR